MDGGGDDDSTPDAVTRMEGYLAEKKLRLAAGYADGAGDGAGAE